VQFVGECIAGPFECYFALDADKLRGKTVRRILEGCSDE
jgi:hypothetical protein